MYAKKLHISVYVIVIHIDRVCVSKILRVNWESFGKSR